MAKRRIPKERLLKEESRRTQLVAKENKQRNII